MNTRINQRTSAARDRNRWPLMAGLVSLCVLVTCGCRVVEETAKLPAKTVAAVGPGAQPKGPGPAPLQTELLRYADEFSGRTVAALDEYARRVGTAEARTRALQLKVSVVSAAVNLASGENPTANLIDFLALATITRTALEEEWARGDAAKVLEPWLETSRALETEAWQMAAGVLTSSQQQELKDSIWKWWQANTGSRTAFFARPQEFASLIRQTGRKSDQPGSVFGMVGLDPMSGLDPAVREVTRTRLFAERALYAVERMPFLVRWQAQLLTEEILQGPQLAATLTNLARMTESADRLSRAAESASQTAASLPDRLTAERKAVLEALEAQEGRLRELSTVVARTLAAGEKMSSSLNITITSFDGLMKRFGVGEPASGPGDTNSTPFNILDYAITADRVAAMAQQLDALLQSANGTLDAPALDKRILELKNLSAQARVDAKSVVNHAFLLGAGLIGLFFVCAGIYRRVGRRSVS